MGYIEPNSGENKDLLAVNSSLLHSAAGGLMLA
jgi:hypothetical protein